MNNAKTFLLAPLWLAAGCASTTEGTTFSEGGASGLGVTPPTETAGMAGANQTAAGANTGTGGSSPGTAGAPGSSGKTGMGGAVTGVSGSGAGTAGEPPATVNGQAMCGLQDTCVFKDARDAAYWPFDACSPWNHPLRDGAVYANIDSFDHRWHANAWFVLDDSHPTYIEAPQFPVRSVYSADNKEGGSANYNMRLPDGMKESCCDKNLHVIDQKHTFVLDMINASVDAGGNITAQSAVRNDLKSSGVFVPGPTQECVWHGSRAYGGSGMGGLVRKGEFANGIRHALALALPPNVISRNTGNNGRHWIWPASCADNTSPTAYATSGNVFMGTLLAIPPDVDLAAAGITHPKLIALARALQLYGGYVVDSSTPVYDNFGSGIAFYAEPGEVPEQAEIGQAYQDLGEVVRLLKVVTNNTSQSVGGTGKPLTCFAPMFAPTN